MTNQSTGFPDTNAPLSRKAATDVRSAIDSAEAAVPELKERVRHMVDMGRTRVTEWKGGFQEGIREKPIQSVLIAAAVGAVIGALVSRRSR
jgi:ElaB/YqjD/DUF883 family membrane-anchored ribosome-binding protein